MSERFKDESLVVKVLAGISVFCAVVLTIVFLVIAWRTDVVLGVSMTIMLIGVLTGVACYMESSIR